MPVFQTSHVQLPGSIIVSAQLMFRLEMGREEKLAWHPLLSLAGWKIVNRTTCPRHVELNCQRAANGTDSDLDYGAQPSLAKGNERKPPQSREI